MTATDKADSCNQTCCGPSPFPSTSGTGTGPSSSTPRWFFQWINGYERGFHSNGPFTRWRSWHHDYRRTLQVAAFRLYPRVRLPLACSAPGWTDVTYRLHRELLGDGRHGRVLRATDQTETPGLWGVGVGGNGWVAVPTRPSWRTGSHRSGSATSSTSASATRSSARRNHRPRWTHSRRIRSVRIPGRRR